MEKSHPSPYQMFFQGILLFGYALFLIKLILSGTLQNFIAPRLHPYMTFTFIACIILGLIQCFRSLVEPIYGHDHSEGHDHLHSHHDHDHSHGHHHGPACDCGDDHHHQPSLILHILFLVPLVMGFLFSNNIIGSSVAENRGVTFGQTNLKTSSMTTSNKTQLTDTSTALKKTNTNQSQSDSAILKTIADMQPTPNSRGIINMDQFDTQIAAKLLQMHTVQISKQKYSDSIAAIESQPTAFKGKPIAVTGFVVRQPGMKSTQIVISRFVITCCIADASVYGLMATSPTLKNYKKDQWLSIEGTLDETTYQDKKIPIIHVTHVTQIPQPKDPYVYSIY